MIVSNITLSKISYVCAIGFGVGSISWIPTGTVASMLAIPIWWVLVCFFYWYQFYFLFLMISIVMGVYFCDYTVKIIGIHDHKSIVWDEFVGMWITLTVIPINNFFWVMVSFFIFRTIDIVKPWPISWCDRNIKGGFGIIIDDVLAGIVSVCIVSFLMSVYNT